MTREDVRAGLRGFLLEELLRDPSRPLAPDEPLLSVGVVDSMSLSQVAVFAERAFGVVIPDIELTVENMDTLEKMTDRVLLHAPGERGG